jgi:twinkle protein
MTTTERDLETGGAHQPLKFKGHPLGDRSISKESCEFFDVKVKASIQSDGTANPVAKLIFPYHTASKGSLCAQKVRTEARPKGHWVGDRTEMGLFGQNKFKSGKTITIVEGEPDVLAYRDLMGDYPVVSPSDGAPSAAKQIATQLAYFQNFKEVVVCFDSDEPGRKAAEEVAKVFPLGKVKIVDLNDSRCKDANDYLIHGKREAFKKAWWNATPYTPAGIEVATEGGFDSLFEEVDDLELYPYPFDGLNETLFGIRKKEMVTVVAGSGVGKSAMIGETAFKQLMDTDLTVGMLMLEESPKKTKLRFMSLFLNKPLHLTLLGKLAKKYKFLENVLNKMFSNPSDYEFDEHAKKDLKRAWDATVAKVDSKGDPKLWLFNHFGSNSTDSIVKSIEHMVVSYGCEMIVLDHISMVVSDQQNGDERKALDELATKLRTLVERHDFALIIVSHLRRPGGKPHEEGGETSLADIRGTAGIGQLSDIVVGLERNQQHPDPIGRNITFTRVLKNRFAGITGLAAAMQYDASTGRQTEMDLEDAKRIIEAEEAPLDDSDGAFDVVPKETPS